MNGIPVRLPVQIERSAPHPSNVDFGVVLISLGTCPGSGSGEFFCPGRLSRFYFLSNPLNRITQCADGTDLLVGNESCII